MIQIILKHITPDILISNNVTTEADIPDIPIPNDVTVEVDKEIGIETFRVASTSSIAFQPSTWNDLYSRGVTNGKNEVIRLPYDWTTVVYFQRY